jgi:exodeoxyribonuclease VII small subunit
MWERGGYPDVADTSVAPSLPHPLNYRDQRAAGPLRVQGSALAYLTLAQRPPIMPEDDVSQLSFEDALAELDQIVRGLEGGTLKLDAAVQAFERGVKLRRHCEAKLAEVEARVEALVQRSDGSLATRPLE